MLNQTVVVCFFWNGTRWDQSDHGEKYINRLYNGVVRNSPYGTDTPFICFTNEDMFNLQDGIEVRVMHSPSWLGVLPRLYMYSEEAGLFGRQILALDLDVIIVGDLTDIMSYSGPFCVRSKFAPGQQHKADGDIVGFKACPEICDALWKPFRDNPQYVEEVTGGRERYWYRHVIGRKAHRWDRLYDSGQIVSYKRHVKRTGKLPKGARIVSCHGRPRPHEIKEPWAKQNWR
jgi:hypothetical protein